MNWYKANRIVENVIFIMIILIFPLFLLRISGIYKIIERRKAEIENEQIYRNVE